MKHLTVLFGEAEKGQFHTPHFLHSVPELADKLGHPPKQTLGVYLSIQAILYSHDIIFFRVEEEGFGEHEYFSGLEYLRRSPDIKRLDAICIPGVGNKDIIEKTTQVCLHHKGLLITTEKDFYDYLTSAPLNG